ncbi:isoquinoline 1-oxidoreductase beta subunit [Aquimarina sp. MAR_2010_214]|uniref:xanthine dehydrogenase family protein molybdopterin-binding subunit n=1 Tax=Aquimarina sp. MAR_2010_214 TaxID=1250026 RepID=UPI000C7019E6|nr:molybdopterin cofactor-binding domain-containing protein [Aquimarina sp. MAR_2010_214]PKV49085.1 isoquinoline 1-oxidoreductase beta subunit [Aquimarina sp. MAR_2010_214]
MNVTRRSFLKVSGKVGGGLVLSLAFPSYGKINAFNLEQKEIEFNNFISIDTNGEITIMLTKHEMGQGTGTSIPTIIADELEADWAKVKIQQVDYSPKYTWQEMGTTGGSGSISRTWDSIRMAGATTKELLKQAAAKKWGVDPLVLEVKNSFITNLVTDETIEFGELAEIASQLPIPTEILLKKPEEYRYIGKPMKNRITKNVISGKAKYGIDMDIPGMVYASIEKCPIYKGKLKNYDDTEAKKIEGVLDIFPIVLSEQIKGILNPVLGYVNEGIVVVAISTWIAFKARKLLKVEWDGGENESRSVASLNNNMQAVKDTPSQMTMDLGNVEESFTKSENKILEMEYDNPYQAHALMEPLNATADFRNDICEIWVGTQDAEQTISEVAKVLEIPSEKVVIHVLNSGGSFGRRYHADTSIEAAFISRKIKKPVKITWTREDEIRNDHFQPYLKNYLKAAITPKKSVEALENRGICTVDYVTWSEKWEHYYAFPNIRCYRTMVPTLLHEGAWRSVGEHSAALSKECFVDELAHELQKDPLEYRIELLSHEVDWGDPKTMSDWAIKHMLPKKKLLRQRQLDILSYIKKSDLWSKETIKGKGKGFAIANFGNTVCAEIAEVTMHEEFGFIVDKVTAIVHCGMVINPHFGKGQIEGSIIWALSAVKYGGVEVENGIVQRNNFHNNKVLRMDELPEIEVVFIKSDERPSGLGEPGTPPLAPAVLNAIFSASGKRIRKIPVTKYDLYEAKN